MGNCFTEHCQQCQITSSTSYVNKNMEGGQIKMRSANQKSKNRAKVLKSMILNPLDIEGCLQIKIKRVQLQRWF